MHTHKLNKEWWVHSNGDLSGDVHICTTEEKRHLAFNGSRESLSYNEFIIPMWVLEELVGVKMRDEEIRVIEDMSGQEFLHYSQGQRHD